MAVYVDGNEVGTIVAATPEGYFDTSDADISEKDVAKDKIAYGRTGKIVGSAEIVEHLDNLLVVGYPGGNYPTTTFISETGELFASNEHTGIWYYDKSINDWLNVYPYTGDYGSVSFWADSKGNIFTSPSGNQLDYIRLFNFETKKFEIVDQDRSISYNITFYETAYGELYASSYFTFDKGVQKFNYETREFEWLTGDNQRGYAVIGEDAAGNVYIGPYHSSDGGQGLAICLRGSKEVKIFYPGINYFHKENFYLAENGYIFLGLYSGSKKKGFLRINPNTLHVDNFFNDSTYSYWFERISGRLFRHFYDAGDRLFVCDPSRASNDLYVITPDSDTPLSIYSDTVSHHSCYWYRSDDLLFVSDYNSSSPGLILINLTNNSASKIYDQGYAWYSISKDDITDTFYITSVERSLGILEYKNGTTTKLFDGEKTAQQKYIRLDDNYGCFIANGLDQYKYSSYSGFYKLDLNTNTVSQALTSWNLNLTQAILYNGYYIFAPLNASAAYMARYKDGVFETFRPYDRQYSPTYLIIKEDSKLYGYTPFLSNEFIYDDAQNNFIYTDKITTIGRTIKDLAIFNNLIFTKDKIYSVPTITTAVEGDLSSMLNQAKKTYLKVESTGKICAVWAK